MKASGWLLGFVTIIAVQIYLPLSVQADCATTSYDLTTTGIIDESNDMMATRGVPFFPECEPDGTKYFRVKSPTDAAIFLSPYARVEMGNYYLIELPFESDTEPDVIKLFKNEDGSAGTPVRDGPAEDLLIATDYVDLYVRVDGGYIQLGKRGEEDSPILSWFDAGTVIDVNYILVQNFNWVDGTSVAQTADWQFCDGAVKLLSYNYDATNNPTVGHRATEDASPCDTGGCGASNAIDGDLGNDASQRTQLESTASDLDPATRELGWWYIDLDDMYDIKTVLILNGDGASIEDELEGTAVHVGSCKHADDTDISTMRSNAQCDADVTTAEAQDQDGEWILKECDKNYYGQYVYLVNYDGSAQITYFALREVEVWGQEISAANKYKIGLAIEGVTGSSVSAIERDVLPAQMYNIIVQTTDGSSENPTCLEYSIARNMGDTEGIGTAGTVPGQCTNEATDDDADDDGDATLGATATLEIPASPPDANTYTITDAVTYNPDICHEEDEMFTYTITPISKGLVAGDSDGGTYETITFNILNDDVTYCWKDLTISVLEGVGMITATLTREGYTILPSTAVVDTDIVGGDNAVASQFTALVDHQVEFNANDLEKDVVVYINDDDCVDLADPDKVFSIVFDIGNSDGGICDEGAVVKATILNDDVQFQFQDNGANDGDSEVYTVSETEGMAEVVVERLGYKTSAVEIRVESEAWNNINNAASLPEDYVQINELLQFATGIDTASFNVTIKNDKEVEPATGAEDEELFRLILVRDTAVQEACVLGTVHTANVRILDDDCFWYITDTVELLENNGPASTTISCERPGCATDPCTWMNRPFTATVNIDSTGLVGLGGVTAATSTEDFIAGQVAVTLPAVTTGTETSTVFTWPIVPDILEEPNESFEIRLTDSDGVIREPSKTNVDILNDDATVSLDCDEVSNEVQEGAGVVTLSLRRTGYLVDSDTVLFYTTPGNGTASSNIDYGLLYVQSTFTSMVSTIPHNITIIQDDEQELDEDFFVQIRPYDDKTYVDPDHDICRWIIKDDDCTFAISATDADKKVTEGSGSSVTVTVTRFGSLLKAASIDLFTSDAGTVSDATAGADYISLSTTVTFPPNDDTETVTITINDDDETESVEYFLVSIGVADCGVRGNSRVVIEITDDDESVVSMSDPKITVSEAVEGGRALVGLKRTGSLSKPETAYLRVRPYTASGQGAAAATPNSDFSDDDVTVNFRADEDVLEVGIPIHDDTFEEGLESFAVDIFSLATGTDATIDDDARETIVCIQDDDGSFSIDVASKYVSEGSGVPLTITRTGDATKEQTVYLSTSDVQATSGTDYQPLRGEPVTFPQNVASRSVTITTYDDQELEGSESFTVYLTSNDGSDLGKRAELITILDDDNEIHFISVPGSTLVDNAVSVSETEEYVQLTIERSSFGNAPPTGTAYITVSARELSSSGIPQAGATPAETGGVKPGENDFEFATTTVTFQGNQRRVDVLVEINDDDEGENTEAFEVYLSNAVPFGDNKIVYPNTVTVYIVDDDGGAPDGGDGGDGGSGGDGTTTLSQPLIIGIAGGVGLLVLVIVLLFIGLAIFSQMRGGAPAAPAPAPAPRPVAAPRPQYQYPPQIRNGPRQPRRVAYYP